MDNKRDLWVDNVKVIACILVVIGHFFQSMVKSNILPNNDLYEYFNQTIYYFHVPLFFICSGFLHQKYNKVNDIKGWKRNVRDKAISLGVPYFTFSIVTWLLKSFFKSSINYTTGNLIYVLFIHPLSPYWYLYTLFILFLITPTFKSKRSITISIIIALAAKLLMYDGGTGIYTVILVLTNEIWFLMGMSLCIFSNKFLNNQQSLAFSLVFIILSLATYRLNLHNNLISFLLGVLACILVVGFLIQNTLSKHMSRGVIFLARYTMPIFLMHTMCAALFRTVLLNLGVTNTFTHVVIGIVISFIGPIFIAKVMKKTKVLDIFLNPRKLISRGSSTYQ